MTRADSSLPPSRAWNVLYFSFFKQNQSLVTACRFRMSHELGYLMIIGTLLYPTYTPPVLRYLLT
jgi:hypothetical protein